MKIGHNIVSKYHLKPPSRLRCFKNQNGYQGKAKIISKSKIKNRKILLKINDNKLFYFQKLSLNLNQKK